MLKSGLFRSGHRMSANKTVIHTKFFNSFMDWSFDTSCICDDTVIRNYIFQIFQIFYIVFYRCTEKDIIAGTVSLILFFQYSVDGVTAECCSQSFFVFCVCQNMIIWMKFADRFCDRSSDKAKPDKTNGFHDV